MRPTPTAHRADPPRPARRKPRRPVKVDPAGDPREPGALRAGGLLAIPAGAAASLDGFRDWVASGEFPENLRASYIDGEILIDMSPEEFESHNKVKIEIFRVLGTLIREADLGEFFVDGAMFTNKAAGVSTEPEAVFVSWGSFEAGRAELVPRKGQEGEFVELKGTPDWVLEVVSRWTGLKDAVQLRDAYHRAGIPEYWLIDARHEEIDFQILRRRRRGYASVAPRDGWLRSTAFGRWFRLERRRNRMGRWSYTLAIRPG